MKISLPEKIKNHKKAAMAAAALLWLLVCMAVTPVYTTVTITFADDPSGEYITTVYAGIGENTSASDARSRVINSGVARISYYDVDYPGHTGLKRIDPIQSDCGETLEITSITVRRNGVLVASIDGDAVADYFTVNEQIYVMEGPGFVFEVTGEDPQLIPTEEFDALYNSHAAAVTLIGFIASALAAVLVFILIKWILAKAKGGTRFQKCAWLLFALAVLTAVLMVIYVGLRSPFWANPDEYDVKSAVLYYFTHWMPPDIRSDEIVDSFPVYGTSRHFEFDMFYFLAGKVGRFFADPSVQIRLFSLIMFTLMAAFAVKNIKKNHALLFVLLLTPQVWYIFTYSTSDAFDFFMGFFCLYELIAEDSMLNRLFKEPFRRRHILYYAVVSFLFLQMLWAKATFYTVLIFAFLILLIRLIYTEKEGRKSLLIKYLVIVGLVLAMFAVRYMITDFRYYGFDKYTAIIDTTNLRADYAYKYSTPASEAAYSMRFYEKGVSLWELLTQYDFHMNLFRTFAGFFGSYEWGEADWYYYVMGALYVVLIVYSTVKIWRQRDGKLRLEAGAVFISILIQYVLIVAQSWLVDFQPQGRYALPVLFFTAYLVSRVENLKEDRVLRTVLICTAVLSLYCFWHVGLPNLVPDTVV